jgi:lantibiotic leader peptide-processing serine protease
MRGSFIRKTLFVGIVVAAIVTAVFFFRPAPAGAQAIKTYVLMASHWGTAQDAAVAAAGGTVTFSHSQTGIGMATSEAPGFLKRVLASRAISRGAEDMMIQWQPPVREGDMIEAAVTPGDETFINLQWNIKTVEAEAAWAAGYTGIGSRVAVLDGGIYNSHIDLAGQIDETKCASFVPGFAWNEDTGTFWHATHVAGIIAAKDNGIGTIGIAPNATIIGVKVLHSGSGYFSWVIAGILYASTPIEEGGAGADIINMSLGALFPKGGGNTGAGLLVAALNKAVNYAGQRTLVVSAAGNNAVDLDHSWSYTFVPAQSGSGIAIAATAPMGFAVNYPNGATNFREPASYTNYGNSLVWLAAPGGDYMLPGEDPCTIPRVPSGSVTTACWVFDMVISCSRGSGSSISSYTWAAGTSMATPAVSAVAALVKQRFPWFGVDDLKTWLAKTADDEGKRGNDPYYGKGFANARRAVTE